ncbi:MAG: hypothetical protein M1347_06355 [Chloroflexi bacterium]|nr:hypothetical protein [Chloroflexota bacterium]
MATYKEKLLQPNFEKAGVAKLKKLRQKGQDPAHGGDAAKKRGRSSAGRAREGADWEAVHGGGEEERRTFVKEIQPKLRNVPLSAIEQATGCSIRYASLIKQGE